MLFPGVDVPMPYSAVLEKAATPSTEDVIRTVMRSLSLNNVES
jgi:pyruvate/2-oxoglutarate/acetoin dehydrogenase E1 component